MKPPIRVAKLLYRYQVTEKRQVSPFFIMLPCLSCRLFDSCMVRSRRSWYEDLF